MDEGNVDFNNEQYLSQSKNTSTEASNNQERMYLMQIYKN